MAQYLLTIRLSLCVGLLFVCFGTLVSAACPQAIQVTDLPQDAFAVHIDTEEDVLALQNNCEVLDANLAVRSDTLKNNTINGLKKINGFVWIYNSSELSSIQFPDLVEVKKFIRLDKLDNFQQSIPFPMLEAIGGNFELTRLPSMRCLSLPSTQNIYELEVNRTSITDIDIPGFSNVKPFGCFLKNNPKLKNFKLHVSVHDTDSQPINVYLVNNTNLKTFELSGYFGHRNSSLDLSESGSSATFSIPDWINAAMITINGNDTINAPSLGTVDILQLENVKKLPDFPGFRQSDYITIIGCDFEEFEFPALTQLRSLDIWETTIASRRLELPDLRIMDVPEGRGNRLRPGTTINIVDSDIGRLSIPRLESFKGAIHVNTSCFDCPNLYEQIKLRPNCCGNGLKIVPGEFNCKSTCGKGVYLSSQSPKWSLPNNPIDDDPTKLKGILVGGTIGGVAAVMLVVVLIGCARKQILAASGSASRKIKESTRKPLDKVPSLPHAPGREGLEYTGLPVPEGAYSELDSKLKDAGPIAELGGKRISICYELSVGQISVSHELSTANERHELDGTSLSSNLSASSETC